MRTHVVTCCLRLLIAAMAVLPAAGARADEARGEFQPPPIEVKAGFVLEVAAAPPLVRYPMMACFDDRGRLFVAESDGQNLQKEGLLEQRPRFIRLLEDTTGDGCFDKSTIFADRMTMPEGGLWHNGALYVVSAPYLWRLEDTDGDGVADKREKILGSMEFDGRANQHGPYLGPNGRLYFSGGTFGYDLRGKDGSRARGGLGTAGVFSCRADGTDVEIVGHAGINPVDVAFTAEGEMFSTCAIFDRVDGRHDALVHWVRGGLYREGTTGSLKDSGHRLPACSRWGQVAPAGLMRYRGTAFGEEYRDSLFSCQFNTQRVIRTRLERHNSTFVTHEEDFLFSSNIDFHPTDVLEDADGSLLLLDTGGWLSWGCPTSQIAKPQIPGAIYRIRKQDAPPIDDPWGLDLDWSNTGSDELISRLDDPRPAVRDRAVEELIKRGDDALPALQQGLAAPNVRCRRNSVWTLSRIGTEAAGDMLRTALTDGDAGVRQAAVRSVGHLKDAKAAGRLQEMLAEDAPPIRRAAATSLGQIGSAHSIEPLFEALPGVDDPFLSHAVTYAVIEIGDFDATLAGLSHSSPQVRRAALVALDQTAGDKLEESHVAPLLETDDPELKAAALQVIAARPDWGRQIVGFLKQWIFSPAPPDPAQANIVRGAVLAFSGDAEVQSLVADGLARGSLPPSTRITLLEAVGRLDELPEAYLKPLAACLSTGGNEIQRQAVETVAALGTTKLDAQLLVLARDKSTPASLRVSAWSVLAKHGAPLDERAFEILVRHVDEEHPPLERLAAAEALASARLTPAQRRRLVDVTADGDPLVLPALIVAFAKSDAATPAQLREEGLRLVRGLEKSPALASLPADRLELVLKRYPDEVRRAAGSLLKRIEQDDQEQAARLQEVTSQLVAGDVARGRQIFFGTQAACSACHQVQGQGGRIGPDLSEVGRIRTQRDLLEAVLFPSATLVNGYESYVVVSKQGRTFTGVIAHTTAKTVLLRNAQRQEFFIQRADIEQIAASRTSMMPQGLDKTMNQQDLSDLLAYLQSLKPPAASAPK